MNIKTNTQEHIEWDIEGCKAFADIDNGVLKEISIKLGDTGNSFTSSDEKYVRDVFKAIGSLISHLDNSRGIGRIKDQEINKILMETEKQIGNGRKEF